MKLNVSISSFAFVFLLASCTKNENDLKNTLPVAGFTWDSEDFVITAVRFKNLSSKADSYLWDFGDSTTSQEANPVHTYAKDGNYRVKLLAYGRSGSNVVSDDTMIRISLLHPIVAKITSVKLLGINFLNTGGNKWDSDTGPDIFFKFRDDRRQNHTGMKIFTDVTPGSFPLVFTESFQNLFIKDVNGVCYISFYDYDLPNFDEIMDDYVFTLADYMNGGHPTTITLEHPGSSNKVELTIQWP